MGLTGKRRKILLNIIKEHKRFTALCSIVIMPAFGGYDMIEELRGLVEKLDRKFDELRGYL